MRTLPDAIRLDNIAGRPVRRDEAGYLVEPQEWSEAVAEHLADEEGIALGPEHHAIIAFMRAFNEEHGVAADARFVFRNMAGADGDIHAARRRFFALFPYGYVKQACKIAGMKQPRAWSTG